MAGMIGECHRCRLAGRIGVGVFSSNARAPEDHLCQRCHAARAAEDWPRARVVDRAGPVAKLLVAVLLATVGVAFVIVRGVLGGIP